MNEERWRTTGSINVVEDPKRKREVEEGGRYQHQVLERTKSMINEGYCMCLNAVGGTKCWDYFFTISNCRQAMNMQLMSACRLDTA